MPLPTWNNDTVLGDALTVNRPVVHRLPKGSPARTRPLPTHTALPEQAAAMALARSRQQRGTAQRAATRRQAYPKQPQTRKPAFTGNRFYPVAYQPQQPQLSDDLEVRIVGAEGIGQSLVKLLKPAVIGGVKGAFYGTILGKTGAPLAQKAMRGGTAGAIGEIVERWADQSVFAQGGGMATMGKILLHAGSVGASVAAAGGEFVDGAVVGGVVEALWQFVGGFSVDVDL